VADESPRSEDHGPDGVRERWTNVAVDRLVTLQRGSAK
jgi:hypothetical protein